MWFREKKDRGSFGRHVRRLHNTRQTLLMVSARTCDQRKRWRQKIAAILVLIVALGGLFWVMRAGAARLADRLWIHNERFLLEKLVVRSDGRLREKHVRLYGGVSEGMGLFQIGLHELHTNLMAIPVVKSVSLQRQLPDTLVVDIRERVPIAQLDTGHRMPPLPLDRDGFVLPPLSEDVSLPLILGYVNENVRPGMQLTAPAVQSALALIPMCEHPGYAGLLNVAVVNIASPYYLDVRLVGGERILMPYENFEIKLRPACAIMKHSADMGLAVAELDMTVDRNFPVKYR